MASKGTQASSKKGARLGENRAARLIPTITRDITIRQSQIKKQLAIARRLKYIA